MRIVIEVEVEVEVEIEVEVEKSFDDKFTAKIDFPIGHFMFTITDADIGSLNSLQSESP